MPDGIIQVRILWDGSQNGTFRQGKITAVLAEIPLGRSLHAIGTGGKIDGIQVILQNYAFGILSGRVQRSLQLQSQILLLELSGESLQCSLVGPVGEHIIFQQLLCQGTGAFIKMEAPGNAVKEGPDNSFDIDTVVFVETFILNGHNGMLHVQRDLIDGDRYPVG